MKEIKYLGIKGTGEIDLRYNVERSASFSIFECPVCKKQYELKTSRGRRQNTCIDCRGTQNESHKMSSTKVYSAWQGMVQRCNNPKSHAYAKYGARGITVSLDWLTFEGFWKDMEATYQPGLTIDRIDSSKGYCKENCRWLTLSQNSSETTKRRPVIQMRQRLSPLKGFVEEHVWESAKKAADALGLVAAHITVVCLGKRKTHGGFGWKYAEDGETVA